MCFKYIKVSEHFKYFVILCTLSASPTIEFLNVVLVSHKTKYLIWWFLKPVSFDQQLFETLFSPFFIFVVCYLAAPWPTLDHYWGDSLNHLMLITVFNLSIISPKVTGSLIKSCVPKPSGASSGLWTGNLQINLQCLDPPGQFISNLWFDWFAHSVLKDISLIGFTWLRVIVKSA